MSSTAAPAIADIEVKPETFPGLYTALVVSVIWSDVDRPYTGGVVVQDQETADRLVRAIRAGVAYPNPRVVTDVDGQTYVQTDRQVMGKYMDADLKRLGF